MMQRDTAIIQNDSNNLSTYPAAPRKNFRRSALCTALATSLFGMAPAAMADTVNNVNNTAITNSSVANQTDNNQTLSNQNNTSQATNNQASIKQAATLSDDDTQLDMALDALRLKKAVEQGIIDQSVLDDYSEQSLGIKKSNSTTQNLSSQSSNSQNATSQNNNSQDLETFTDSPSTSYNSNNAQAIASNDDLLQQATEIQQQGYQMMTPEQIDRELAAMDAQNAQDIDSINISNNDSDFDAPIATLDGATSPIGLDVELDATNLPVPSNLDTLGRNETPEEQASTAEGILRPSEVSGAASNEAVVSNEAIVSDEATVTSESGLTPDNGSDEVIAGTNEPTNAEGTSTDIINPNDYLPDYQNETQAVDQSIEQAKRPRPRARNRGNIVTRLYNRFFNDGGVVALPNVETDIYLEQVSAEDSPNGQAQLIEADSDIQPMKNIKAALDDTSVQSVVDFTAALPRLRETAQNAAKAVGYYEVELRLTQPDRDTVNVIIEELGEPVLVDSRIIEIRGEGSEQEEFAALEADLLPQEGDIFNHRVYKSSKAALESLSNTYGYFDQYWLNKSVDIILPDNKADVSLVYNTGDRYEFDDVVFFTYDKETNTLTQDPDKLPVELSLLQQLYGFTPGEPFYRPAVTKFSNDLSATRYFNTVNVESILPPSDSSEAGTLAFDNTATESNGTLDDDINNVDNDGIVDLSSNDGAAASNVTASTEDTINDNSDIGAESDDALSANSGETVNEADIAAIDFEADEATLDKLQEIRQKAERLSSLPNDRVLDEKEQEAENLLGKISDSISNVAQKIFPDEESLLADENFVPPTLAGRKTPQDVAESKKIPLYVFVAADKPRDAQVGLGYGTDAGVRATAKVDYNLLNRQGYQAGAETEVSRISKNVAVYASRPWKHPLNDKLDGRLTYEEEVIDQGEGNFDLSTKTIKAELSRNIRSDTGWNRSYSVRYRLDELETGVDGADLDDLPIRFTSSSPEQRALLFGYGVSKTDTDNATNPTQGMRQYYSIEAGTDSAFSDTDMAIIRAGVSGIYSFGEDKKHQVLGSANAGYIWADDFYEVPYKLRFFAGGDQSIRGYDYESLSPLDKGYLTGGQVLAVGSAEYNYEFKPGFRGALFTDVGNAYDKDFDTETKVGVGVGIRWASPVGMVRVDVAAGVTEESIPVRLHFFIGSPL